MQSGTEITRHCGVILIELIAIIKRFAANKAGPHMGSRVEEARCE
jgi:hypothetical protein